MRHDELALMIRPARPEDESFIKNAWLKSLAESMCGPHRDKITGVPDDLKYAGIIRRIHAERYYDKQEALIEILSGIRKLRIACDPTMEEFIYGFACGDRIKDELVMDYVYVKKTYRRMGIARYIMEKGFDWTNETIVATHWTFALNPVAVRNRIWFDDYYVKLGAV